MSSNIPADCSHLKNYSSITITMARKKKGGLTSALELESSVAPIVEVAYSDPLFSVAAHPTKPILLSGLATGHLFCHTYDAEKLEDEAAKAREKLELIEKNKEKKLVSQLQKKWWSVIRDHKDVPENSGVVTNWKTKRHKGSCRSVIFDILENSIGEQLYSVGTDHIIKKAATETGRVTSKSEITAHYDGTDAITNLALSPTHPLLLAGTESGHVLVFDSNDLSSNKLKFKLPLVHEDSINKILPMPAVSAYHFLTLGSTTMAHVDIRKGIITQSDDQADELLSMCFATDSVNDNNNDTVLVSHGEGIVTLWRNSTNRFMDQLSRVKVNKSASIDAIIPTMNAGDDDMRDSVWCGDSEGLLHRVNYKKGKVVETRVHSSSTGKHGGIDEVGGLDIDYDYRLISSGMEGLKIWSGQTQGDQDVSEDEDASDSDSDSDSGSDAFSDSDSEILSGSDKEVPGSGSEEASADESEGSDDEEIEQPKIVRKKRLDITQVLRKPAKKKIDINRITRQETATEAEQPQKKKLKKLKAQGVVSSNGIRRFEGM